MYLGDILNKKTKGILLIINSAFFFALMNMFVKLSGDLPTFQKVFFRNAIAAVIALIMLIKNNKSFKPKNRKTFLYMLLRTFFGFTGVVCNYYALDRLVLSDASILNKLSPFFAILFAYVFLKEKPKLYQWILVGGAFVGALFVIKPSFDNPELFASVCAFMGGLTAGAAYGCVRKLGVMGEENLLIVFFFSAVSTLISAPVALIVYEPMSLYQLTMLLLAGVVAAIAQFSITAAYTYAPPKEISVYDFSQIIFAAALSYIVFSQLPDLLSVIGYIIIVSMAVINYLITNKKAQVDS